MSRSSSKSAFGSSFNENSGSQQREMSPRSEAAQKFFDGGQAGTLSDNAQSKGLRPPKGKGKSANGSSKGGGRKPGFPSMESVTVPGTQGVPYKMASEPLTMSDYRDHCIALTIYVAWLVFLVFLLIWMMRLIPNDDCAREKNPSKWFCGFPIGEG